MYNYEEYYEESYIIIYSIVPVTDYFRVSHPNICW